MFQVTDLVNYEKNHSFSPCVPFFYGMESCTKGHSYGPRIRDYILIHFVLSGKGTVDVDDRKYSLTSNEAFIIPANSKCRYIADQSEPWEYCWVAFYAPLDVLPMILPIPSKPYIYQNINVQYIKSIILKVIAKQFSFQKNIYSEKEFDSRHLHLASNFDIALSFDMTASLYQILSYIIIRNKGIFSEKERRLHDIKKYIDCYYNEPIQVKTIAREFSIHPNYLTSAFKAEFGTSPKQYIMNKRMSAACNFLETSDYSIKDISYMVGYENQLEFSQLFKKTVGKSPTAYRKNLVQTKRRN